MGSLERALLAARLKQVERHDSQIATAKNFRVLVLVTPHIEVVCWEFCYSVVFLNFFSLDDFLQCQVHRCQTPSTPAYGAIFLFSIKSCSASQTWRSRLHVKICHTHGNTWKILGLRLWQLKGLVVEKIGSWRRLDWWAEWPILCKWAEDTMTWITFYSPFYSPSSLLPSSSHIDSLTSYIHFRSFNRHSMHALLHFLSYYSLFR